MKPIALALLFATPVVAAPPNVVIVITDDQGFGDLGCHGNPVIQTPHIDRLAKQSVELTRFHVNPVCSPTRASLLTGRDYYRTGVVDTFIGRSLMRPEEVTLAELLSKGGYRCGQFGKWHLGDNYPLRPQDQGFHESLMLRGGGIGQPSDPPGSSYHRPILEHNGRLETFDRYCSDVYTDAAIRFIEQSKGQPFFTYLAFNCPHAPLQAPEADTVPYTKLDLSPAAFPKIGWPLANPQPAADVARIYGMVTNIDANVGRLLAKLDKLKVADNTIVIFLTDNGPQQPRYNAGLRNRKGTVYDGGIRVPFFVRWPAGGLPAGQQLDAPAAHIDVVPTLFAACGLAPPTDRKLDGVSLLLLLRGEAQALPERTLFFQWHRGDAPEKGRAFAARGPRYKLVQATGVQPGQRPPPKFELFDLANDPYEQNDLADKHPEVVAQLRGQYERWFDDVGQPHNYAPVRIHLGTPHENPTRLTRQDWRGPQAGWTPTSVGHWEVTVARAGRYDVTPRFAPTNEGDVVRFRLAGTSAEGRPAAGAASHGFAGLTLPAGDARLEVWVERGGGSVGVLEVEVKRTE